MAEPAAAAAAASAAASADSAAAATAGRQRAAGSTTPRTADQVAVRARQATDLADLDVASAGCFACDRLVAWREEVAAVRRAAFRDQEYWGRPVPGFGDTEPRIAILGLAPAAHGGNRTGRVFTGDRSGDVLFAALHRAGLANQPTSVAIDDGLTLRQTRIVAAVRCAPPDNKPSPVERDTCAPWLHREFELIAPTLRVVVALGAFAWAAWWPVLRQVYGVRPPTPRPRFGHAAHWTGNGVPELLGCYHVSQQNTFTGRLTPAMLDAVFARARQRAGVD